MTRLTLPRYGACILVLVATVLATLPARAQAPHMNHCTIFVVDLQKSADFYQNVLGLKTIPEPFHDSKHVWVQIGDHAQLHIVSGVKQVYLQDPDGYWIEIDDDKF